MEQSGQVDRGAAAAAPDRDVEEPAEREADEGEPADEAGEERFYYKSRVRRLKALGLTESLAVGYRLSPRGQAFLAQGG